MLWRIHPRPWHVISDDIIYAGSEMNVDTDEFLKSLKSLQFSPCECSAKEPGLGLPNQHAKACPRFQTMHCWCPPAAGPNQPHLSSCTQYKRPSVASPSIDKLYIPPIPVPPGWSPKFKPPQLSKVRSTRCPQKKTRWSRRQRSTRSSMRWRPT